MWHRMQIALVFLAPVALIGGLYLLGLAIPVPHLGRDYVIRLELPEAGEPVGLPPVAGPTDPSRPLVVIDAGHGGHDPGARVALTRDDDRFLVLEERVSIARALGADLFLSIHADSAGEKDEVSGASVYTLSEGASSEAAARFAARENSADQVNGVPLAGRSENVNSILVELSQRRSSEGSAGFAGLVLREGEGVLRFHPQARRSASLAVLRAPDVPSVLYEAGFVTNPEDADRLASPEGRERFATAMARAIRIHFAREAGA